MKRQNTQIEITTEFTENTEVKESNFQCPQCLLWLNKDEV